MTFGFFFFFCTWGGGDTPASLLFHIAHSWPVTRTSTLVSAHPPKGLSLHCHGFYYAHQEQVELMDALVNRYILGCSEGPQDYQQKSLTGFLYGQSAFGAGFCAAPTLVKGTPEAPEGRGRMSLCPEVFFLCPRTRPASCPGFLAPQTPVGLTDIPSNPKMSSRTRVLWFRLRF